MLHNAVSDQFMLRGCAHHTGRQLPVWTLRGSNCLEIRPGAGPVYKRCRYGHALFTIALYCIASLVQRISYSKLYFVCCNTPFCVANYFSVVGGTVGSIRTSAHALESIFRDHLPSALNTSTQINIVYFPFADNEHPSLLSPTSCKKCPRTGLAALRLLISEGIHRWK